MKIDHPTATQIPQLLSLWKDAFGEHNGFWELFLQTGFSLERCRCIVEAGQVSAALCWLDASLDGQKLAYLYAVVTHPGHRGQGLCRTLLADTHCHLAAQGYSGALLVPENEALRRMYGKLGYETATGVCEFTCGAGTKKIFLRAIGPEEYGALRRDFLPPGGVVQEGENLSFLSQQAQFYTGEDFLMAAYAEGDTLTAMELLGDPQNAPGILAALDCRQGHFRTPGTQKKFAMFHPLQDGARKPLYFGFAFD